MESDKDLNNKASATDLELSTEIYKLRTQLINLRYITLRINKHTNLHRSLPWLQNILSGNIRCHLTANEQRITY